MNRSTWRGLMRGAACLAAGASLIAAAWRVVSALRDDPSITTAEKTLRPDAVSTRSDDVRVRASLPPTRSPVGSPSVSASCVTCHRAIVEAYADSGMSHTWGEVGSVALDAAVASQGVRAVSPPYDYETIVVDGGIRQTERYAADVNYLRQGRAAYQVGSGRHAFSLVEEKNGYLSQLPLAWYAHDGQWALSPGYELNNKRFDRQIQAECVACHGGTGRVVSASAGHRLAPVQSGIRCETCHGPSEDHVARFSDLARHEALADGRDAAANRPAAVDDQPSSPDPPARSSRRDTEKNAVETLIIHPGKLDSERANDICLQCHLQGDAVIYRPGSDAFSFQPGQRLRDHRVDYLVHMKDSDVLGVASHGGRMLQSRCYAESQGRLTCVLCHDPHRPVETTSRLTFDQKCLTCHQPADCHRPPALTGEKGVSGESAELNCSSCHMPQRSTREGQHLVFTDHWIRVPDARGRSSVSGPSIRPDADLELMDSRPEPRLDGWFEGAACVRLHETMGPQTPTLKKGIALLEQAHRRDTADPDIRYWLASGLISLRQGPEAARLLEPAVSRNPGWAEARFRLALAHDQAGMYEPAIRHYEQLISDTPDWVEPYALLARLYLYRQDGAAALDVLRRQVALRDDAEAHAAMALALRLQNAPLAASLEQIDRSLELNPRCVAALLNRGFLLAEAGRLPEARSDFQNVLQLDPANPKAIAGLRSLP